MEAAAKRISQKAYGEQQSKRHSTRLPRRHIENRRVTNGNTKSKSEIVTTTLYSRSRKIADNVTENNALLSASLQMKGRAKPISGGREIVKELSHAENQTYKRYSGYEHSEHRAVRNPLGGGLCVETGSRGGHNQWT